MDESIRVLLVSCFLIALMGLGLEIAKCGGFKNFFQDIINWIKRGIS